MVHKVGDISYGTCNAETWIELIRVVLEPVVGAHVIGSVIFRGCVKTFKIRKFYRVIWVALIPTVS